MSLITSATIQADLSILLNRLHASNSEQSANFGPRGCLSLAERLEP
jgi:hypothetical protein